MKGFNIFLVFLVLISGCKQQEKTNKSGGEMTNTVQYMSVGKEIGTTEAEGSAQMLDKYEALEVGDTLNTKFKAEVASVCQAKGCWMKVELEDGQEAMVRFKDYGFFVPKDISGKQVVINGLAFVEEMSVEDQKHFAKDGGKSEEEIAAITVPKKTYGFEADGVIILN
ncbi:MAG: DUF4920 domain-containing protein [Eudoraea sp.]|nr:DUF4920 domain-containing protein [Eudoraea sp.]